MNPTRESMRAQFPEIAELVDALRAAGFAPKVESITDHAGNLLAGKVVEPDPATFEVAIEAVELLRGHAAHVESMRTKPWPKVQR